MKIIKEVFDPINTLIILLTILFFMTIEILFFWYIVSKEIEKIIQDKSNIISTFAKENKDFKEYIEKYMQDNESNLKNSSEYQYKIRSEENYKLFYDKFSIPICVIITCIIINIIYLIHIRRVPTKIELLLFGLIIFSFITEFIFYFVVIKEWKYISDNKIYNILFSK